LDRQRAESDKQQADAARQQAEADRQRAEAERMAALAAREAAERDAAAAREEAARLAQERAELRDQIQQQLNVILETRQTARGLIVNMSDVLFDFDKATLKPGAREKLAKIAGIIMAHPDLQIEIEGHADSTGSDDYNQGLSERRAESVRRFLVDEGVDGAHVQAHGFGESRPVASNDTDAGRQQNRRVDLVISGESIALSSIRTGNAASTR
ncbi:MAG: OmpA family protein, partial [Acidimicrobiia bacterium]|nr:OmpA family protein [Acidimicrobiia bacterium]